jgi:hypothetical protein
MGGAVVVVKELLVMVLSAAGAIVDEAAAEEKLVEVLWGMEPLTPAWFSQGLGGEGVMAEEGCCRSL